MDVSEIISRLDSIGFEDTSDEDKMDVINDTLWDVESRELWPFLEKIAQLDVTAGGITFTDMPTDYKSTRWLYDNKLKFLLIPERVMTIYDHYPNASGAPFAYYFVGNNIRIFPPAEATETNRYHMGYQATQPELTTSSLESDILLPKRHHRIILLGALWRLYKNEDDPEQGNMFQQDYEARISQMRSDLFGRQYQRADQIFVVDEDDEYYV